MWILIIHMVIGNYTVDERMYPFANEAICNVSASLVEEKWSGSPYVTKARCVYERGT